MTLSSHSSGIQRSGWAIRRVPGGWRWRAWVGNASRGDVVRSRWAARHAAKRTREELLERYGKGALR